MSITAYYTKMKILWDEMCNYRPIPVCLSGSGCCCEAVKIVKKYRDNDYVLCFLRGLNDNFAAARSQILLMDPLPDFPEIFSMIIQQERHLNIGVLPEPVALAVQSASSQASVSPSSYAGKGKPSYQKSNTKGQRQCTHCGRQNHTVDTCFQKHGYPPGFPNGYKPKKAFIAASGDIGSTDEDQSSSGVELTREQLQSLLALLPSSKPTASSLSSNIVTSYNAIANGIGNIFMLWVIDSGATDHIACSLTLFVSYYKITPVTVSLPNKATTLETCMGTVILSSTLTLHNVLYVPTFDVNLVSVQRLTKTLPNRIVF